MFKFNIFNKVANVLSNNIKKDLINKLYDTGSLLIEHPSTDIHEIQYKNNALFLIIPLSSIDLNEILDKESKWRADQSKDVALSYLPKNDTVELNLLGD